MEEKIEIGQFQRMLQFATDRHGLESEKTFVEITWWDHKFLPLDITDVDSSDESLILVFGDTPCQSYNRFKDKMPFPTGFWIWKEATDESKVVHKPVRVSHLFPDGKYYGSQKFVKFLICNSPINYFININPFQTRVYKNRNHETILCFYVDDRDGGEYRPIEKLKASDIKLFEDK